MSNQDQSLKPRLDLNKPLPLRPANSADTSSHNSCSSYSLMLNNGRPVADQDISGSSHDRAFMDFQKIDDYRIHETPQGMAPIMGTTNTTGVTATTLEQDLLSSIGLDIGDKSLDPAATSSEDNGFKALGYDQVVERPIISQPQASLIDLTQRKRKRLLSFQLFKRSAPDKATKDTHIKTVLNPVIPRPSRPPRRLCPSPPYNTDNMPGWTGPNTSGVQRPVHKLNLDKYNDRRAGKKAKDRTGLASNSANFVSRLDLFPNSKIENLTETSKHGGSIPHKSSLGKLRTSASSYLRTLRSEKGADKSNTSAYVGAPTELNSCATCVQEGTRRSKWKHRRDVVRELDHVPEDASLHSFSVCGPQNLEIKRRCSYRIGTSLRSTVQSDCSQYTSDYSNSNPDSASPLALNQQGREEDLLRGQHYSQAGSNRLRDHNQTKEDQPCDQQPQTPDRSSNVQASTPQRPIRIDPDNPRLSVTEARLAQLCADDYSPSACQATRNIDRGHGYGYEMANCYACQSRGLSATSQDLEPYYTLGDTISNTSLTALPQLVESSPQQQPESNSSSLASPSRADRIFTGSTVQNVFESPMTDLNELPVEVRSRPQSPLLPPIPLRVRFAALPRQSTTNAEPLKRDLKKPKSMQRLSRDMQKDIDYHRQSPRRSVSATPLAPRDSLVNSENPDRTSIYHMYHAEATPISTAACMTSLPPPPPPSPSPPPIPLRSPLRVITGSHNIDAWWTRVSLNDPSPQSPSSPQSPPSPSWI